MEPLSLISISMAANSLAGNDENFFHQAGSALSTVLAFLPWKYSADRSAKNTLNIIENQQFLQERRHEFELEMRERVEELEFSKMKLQYVTHLERLEFDAEQQELNREFQAWQNKLSREHQSRLEEFRQRCETARMLSQFEFEKQLAQERKALELELQQRSQEFQVFLACLSSQIQRQRDEFQLILRNHPWRLLPSQILDYYEQVPSPCPPLLAISAPDAQIFTGLANQIENQVSIFCESNYPRTDKNRPIRCIPGIWNPGQMSNDTAVVHLHSLLKTIPAIVLEAEIAGEELNFRMFTWDMQPEPSLSYDDRPRDYRCWRILSAFKYKEFLTEIQRKKARQWKVRREAIQAAGIQIEDLLANNPNGEEAVNEHNLNQLGREERLQEVDPNVKLPYRPSPEGIQEFGGYLKILYCVAAGLAADDYYLLRYNVLPKLPELLSEMLAELPDKEAEGLMGIIVKHYSSLAEEMSQAGFASVPDLLLDLALAIAKLPEKWRRWAEVLFQLSLEYWLKERKQQEEI